MTPARPSPLLPCLAAVLCLAAAPGEAATYRKVVNVAPGHVAWIHRAPDPASPHIGYLKAGAANVQTLGCRKLAKGGWCRVERHGTRGWVQDRYLATGAVLRG